MAQPETGKVAFVTGASSGIGRATAAAFAAKGYAVALVDFDEEKGREAEAAIRAAGGECMFIACDVSNDESVKQAVERTVSGYGRLDAAFNAAGIDGEHGNFAADCTIENWHKVLGVNLTGVWQCMRHQIPQMLKTGGGAIVNCASTAGLEAAPGLAAYCASKHGVIGVTKAAAIEYARQGIRVNAVCPGMIETPMMAGLDQEVVTALVERCPMGRQGRPEEIASAVLWLCDESASYTTGQALAVDGAWTIC